MDLTIDNITENVRAINAGCPDRRLKYLLERAVAHLHDLVRETRLSTEEWMATLGFLTKVGQTCTETRQEFILLSDILGVSLLVDSIDHPKPEGSTEGTVLGPFHTHEAKDVTNGAGIASDTQGEPLLVLCSVRDTDETPLGGVRIDVWETDSKGFYDVQYADHGGPDGRAVLTSEADGSFWFKAIVPVPYPIPNDGPVGKLLGKLGRHCYRPSHMHFMFNHPVYDPLITYVPAESEATERRAPREDGRRATADCIYSSLYLKNDPYERTDAVFGVKNSLVVELGRVEDAAVAQRYGVEVGCALMQYEFVLVTKEEASDLRFKNAAEAMEAQGIRMDYIDGLPVPELD